MHFLFLKDKVKNENERENIVCLENGIADNSVFSLTFQFMLSIKHSDIKQIQMTNVHVSNL